MSACCWGAPHPPLPLPCGEGGWPYPQWGRVSSRLHRRTPFHAFEAMRAPPPVQRPGAAPEPQKGRHTVAVFLRSLHVCPTKETLRPPLNVQSVAHPFHSLTYSKCAMPQGCAREYLPWPSQGPQHSKREDSRVSRAKTNQVWGFKRANGRTDVLCGCTTFGTKLNGVPNKYGPCPPLFLGRDRTPRPRCRADRIFWGPDSLGTGFPY